MITGRGNSLARLSFLAVIAAALIGCADTRGHCCEVPLHASSAAEERAASGQVDFSLVQPCAFTSGLAVERVITDQLPGSPPLARVTYIVSRDGERAFLLSESSAELPFSQIPQGSRRLRVEQAGTLADGFVGASGSGEEIVYLRWRIDGVTSELAATLRPWLLLREVEDLASELMDRPR